MECHTGLYFSQSVYFTLPGLLFSPRLVGRSNLDNQTNS
jgi:hypothetical protein